MTPRKRSPHPSGDVAVAKRRPRRVPRVGHTHVDFAVARPLPGAAFTTATALPAIPARPADGHKGTFGTVIVIGGCTEMIGAPALCASAALRGGVGLVKIATLASVLPYAITIEPSATGVTLSGRAKDDLAALDKADPKAEAVLAIGPGMGQRWPWKMLSKLMQGKRPIVLDADGLNMLANHGSPRKGDAPLVLTPHPGEFRRLARPLGITHDPTDAEARPAAAAALAQKHRAVVVLKGHRTIVSDGEHTYTNTTGNPALATAGSGDVLTGLIAGLLAQGLTPFDAATLGVYLHGSAADVWAKRWGPTGMTARDLAGLVPEALRKRRHAATAQR